MPKNIIVNHTWNTTWTNILLIKLKYCKEGPKFLYGED